RRTFRAADLFQKRRVIAHSFRTNGAFASVFFEFAPAFRPVTSSRNADLNSGYMETEIKQINDVEYELEITASADELADDLKAALRRQRNQTVLKGFRPG